MPQDIGTECSIRVRGRPCGCGVVQPGQFMASRPGVIPGVPRERSPLSCRALRDHLRHEGQTNMSVADTAASSRRNNAPFVRDALPADHAAIRDVVISQITSRAVRRQ